MRLKWYISDDTDTPITAGGAYTSIRVRRSSDGYILDWNDSTFKNTGWTAISGTFTDMNVTYFPGYYEKDVVTAGWVDGDYFVTFSYSNSGIVRQASGEVLISNGKDFESQVLTELLDVREGTLGKWTLDPVAKTMKYYRSDSTTVLKNFALQDTSSLIPVFIGRTPV